MQRLFEDVQQLVMTGRSPWFPFWYNWIVYPIGVALFYVLWGYIFVVNKITEWCSK